MRFLLKIQVETQLKKRNNQKEIELIQLKNSKIKEVVYILSNKCIITINT
jgi:hypothetical protein